MRSKPECRLHRAPTAITYVVCLQILTACLPRLSVAGFNSGSRHRDVRRWSFNWDALAAGTPAASRASASETPTAAPVEVPVVRAACDAAGAARKHMLPEGVRGYDVSIGGRRSFRSLGFLALRCRGPRCATTYAANVGDAGRRSVEQTGLQQQRCCGEHVGFSRAYACGSGLRGRLRLGRLRVLGRWLIEHRLGRACGMINVLSTAAV